jgi:hypothetical protein
METFGYTTGLVLVAPASPPEGGTGTQTLVRIVVEGGVVLVTQLGISN